MSRQVEKNEGETAGEVVVRQCRGVEEFDACVRLQREVFGLPDLEVSPRRHLIVSESAGGWTLGAFAGDELVGFVHHLVAARGNEVIGYSHMMAVAVAYQNKGLGARLKWAQRERALSEGRRFIKWTWEPMRARNAHFNINRLGVTVSVYAVNYYGTDYHTRPDESGARADIDSDRLFAGWDLRSPRVETLARGEAWRNDAPPAATVEIPPDWNALLREDPATARQELLRVRAEFQSAFSARLICAGFDRAAARPRYLLYEEKQLLHE